MSVPAVRITLANPLPHGFPQYRAALKIADKGNADEPSTGRQDTDSNEGQKEFTLHFEDIREIRRSGARPLVIKTHSKYKKDIQQKGQFGDESLLLRRIEEEKPSGLQKWNQLEIQSSALRAAFATLAKGITSIKLFHDPIIILEPYREIYYTRDSIQKALAETKDDSLRAELRLFIEFQVAHMKETLDTILSFKTSGTVSFEWLWALFPPGEPVVIENKSATINTVQWFATVKDFKEFHGNDGSQGWSITVTHTGFNGMKLGTVETSYLFPAISGIVPIRELPIYPCQYCDNREAVEELAVERGKRYETFCHASVKWKGESPIGTAQEHSGPIWTRKDSRDDDKKGCRLIDSPSRTINGTTIVDFEEFFRESPVFRERVIEERDNRDATDSDDDDDSSLYGWSSRRPRRADTFMTLRGPAPRAGDMKDEEYLTCSPLVPVFSFAIRDWGFVLIDDLHDISKNGQAFEELRVENETKGMVHDLVQGFFLQDSIFKDFVKGKGQGLVFLLYGPPGCGKTMTAESISELLGKPLYHLSGGQLGSKVEDVEYALESAFKLAARWDTILLLDEADSFMARRDGGDIERNSLIAVFLRLLEYQPGMVFLTTNRENDIDDAFSSRIHLQLQFEPLDSEMRRRIWDRLARKNGNCELTDEQLMELGERNFNGRQITNVLRMAFLFAANRSLPIETESTALSETSQKGSRTVEMTFQDIKRVLPLATPKIGRKSDRRDV